MDRLQPRPLPSETITGLVPPLAGFPFFAHADRLLFQAGATEYSPVNAWWLADASFLAYGTAEFIEGAWRASPLPAQGYQLDWLGTARDNRGMVLKHDAAMIIVFRGTRLETRKLYDWAEIVTINEDDLRTDTRFWPAACRAGGHVHEGFRTVYAEISDRLESVVATKRPGQMLWLTGHSLGGALATLAAAHYQGVPLQGLYTYGAPRIGDARFVEILPRRSHYRFVHRDDWVPTLPPELLGYTHGGILHQIHSSGPRRFWDDVADGANRLLASAKSLAREFHWDMGELPFKIAGLADHAAVYYATLLWNAMLEAPQ